MQLTVLASLAKCSHFALLLFQAIACAGEDRIFFNRYILENGNLKAQIGELVEAQSIPVGVPKICLKRDAERRCSLTNETMFLCVAAQWSKETRTRLTPLPLDVDEKKEGKKKKTKKKKKKSKKKVSDDMGDEFYNSDSKIAAPFVHVGKAPEPAELLAKMQLDVPAVETSEQASKEEDRPTLNRKNTKGTMVAEPEPMPSFLAHGKPKSEPGNCASSCDKNTCGGVSPDLYVDDGFGGKIKKKDKKRRTKPENDVSVEDYAKQIGWEKVPRDSSTEEGLARVTEVLESAKQKLKCPEPGPETGWPPPGMEIVNDRHALPRLKSVLTAIEVIEHVSSEEEMLLEHRDKHGEDTKYLIAVGHLYKFLNDLPKAIMCYYSALVQNPMSRDALFVMSDVTFTYRYWLDCEYISKKIFKLPGGNKLAKNHFVFGKSMLGQGRHAEAKVALEASLKLQPGLKQALVALNEVNRLTQGDHSNRNIILALCMAVSAAALYDYVYNKQQCGRRCYALVFSGSSSGSGSRYSKRGSGRGGRVKAR